MKNKKKPSVEIKKIDAETSEPIAGVHFEITNKNTRQVYMGVTDQNGRITLSDVEEGWYEVTEVTPAKVTSPFLPVSTVCSKPVV